MKDQLYNVGPLENAFAVYQDFLTYKSGVYYHKNGGFLGYHATMDIGYGNEGGLDYWLVQNSWGVSWGMSGFFKIKQGDVGINDYAMACAL